MPEVQDAMGAAGAGFTTFAHQCALGARVRKYTTVAHAPALRGWMGSLERAQCAHGDGGHVEVAHGRDASGAARTPLTAAYPRRMNELLAEALTAAAAADERYAPRGGVTRGSDAPRADGRRVRDGAVLTPYLRAAVESARRRPSAF
eukprot:895505-Pleurochrysis_carterae.AAC.1